jgi:hypothetical protein
MAGVLGTDSSTSICEASEMDATGVLSSWVMLLTKSFFISLSLRWRSTMRIM